MLSDDQTLQEQNIRNNSTIHVLQKRKEPTLRDMSVSEAEIEAACNAFSRIADFPLVSVSYLYNAYLFIK